MTDFLTWWADHWPLIPVLIAYALLRPILTEEMQFMWERWSWAETDTWRYYFWKLGTHNIMAKRRREP